MKRWILLLTALATHLFCSGFNFVELGNQSTLRSLVFLPGKLSVQDVQTISRRLELRTCELENQYIVEGVTLGHLDLEHGGTVLSVVCDDSLDARQTQDQIADTLPQKAQFLFTGKSIYSKPVLDDDTSALYFLKVSYFNRKDHLKALGSLHDKLNRYSFHVVNRLIPNQSLVIPTPSRVTLMYFENDQAYEKLRENTKLWQEIKSFNQRYLRSYAYIPLRLVPNSKL